MNNLYLKPVSHTKAVGEKPIMLAADIPENCQTYIFYIPALMKDYEDLKSDLFDAGIKAGNNFFVGFWSMAAPEYKRAIDFYHADKPPAVVIVASPKLSADNSGAVYARIDNPHVLGDRKKASEVITNAATLFIEGKIKEGIKGAETGQVIATLEGYLRSLGGAITQFLSNHTITFEYAGAKVSVEPSKKE